MKRKLTYEEIQFVIKQEGMCGVCDLLQEIFALNPRKNEIMHKRDYEVVGEIDEEGRIGEVEVINSEKL